MNNENPLPDEDWLLQADERYRVEDVPHQHRPWQAWRDYSVENGIALELTNPLVKRIFTWFAAMAPKGSQIVGPLYRGAYYYDAEFWPVDIPVFFGTVSLEPLKALMVMPKPILLSLHHDSSSLRRFFLHWGSCIDYILSFGQLRERKTVGFAEELLVAANRELTGSSALLLSGRPGAKAGHSVALAAEMFMKWSLVRHSGLTEEVARRHYSHNLQLLADDSAAYAVPPLSEQVRRSLANLPKIEDRYTSFEPTSRALWEMHELLQDVAARFLRSTTGENVRQRIVDEFAKR